MNSKLKNPLLLFLFFLISVSGFSQEPAYECGDMITNDNLDADITKIISSDEEGFYTLREGGPITDPKVFLEKYDYNYKRIFSKSILATTSGVMGNSLLYRKVLAGKDKFYVFYDGWIAKEQKAYYFVRTFNTSGDEEGTGREIKTMKAEKQINSGNYHPVLSPDKSKLLLLAELPFMKETNEKMMLTVFDISNWKELWNKEVTLDIPSKRSPNNNPLVDNQGNAYVFKTIVISAKEGDQHFIYTCSATGQEWKQNIITNPGKVINSSKFFINNQGDVVLAGLQSPSRTDDQGTVYVRINGKTLALEANKWDAFGADYLKNFMSESAAIKPNAKIMNLKIKNAFNQSDGKTVLVVEEQSETRAPVTPGSFDMIYTVRTENISVFCFAKDGSRPWFTVFKKDQTIIAGEKETRFGSALCAMLKDKLYILWNNTALTPGSIPPQSWKEPDGTKYQKLKVFDPSTTLHATFMWAVEPDGKQTYAETRTHGVPLANLHKGSVYELSLNPNISLTTPDGIIVISEIREQSKVYRFCKIKL